MIDRRGREWEQFHRHLRASPSRFRAFARYAAPIITASNSTLIDRFAAIVPFAARATADPAATAATLSHTPVYIGAGETDRGFTALCRQMYEALLTAGHQDVTFRVVPGGNHFSYSVMYTDPKFWEWLSSKRLSQRPATRPVDTTQAKR